VSISVDPKSRIKNRKRRARWLVVGVVLGACGIGWLCAWLVSDYLADRRYRAAADRLDPGWRAESLVARLQPIADAQNSAIRVSEISADSGDLPALPQGTILELLKADPTVRLDADEAASLRSELGPVDEALGKARSLAGLPEGRFPGARPIVTSLAPVPNSNLLRTIPFSWAEDDVRRVAYLLARYAVLRAEAGDCEAAVVSVCAMFNVGRSFGDEPSRVAQDVRSWMTATAMRFLERVLAQGEVAEPVLASFQALLEDEEAHPGLLTAVRGDRAAVDDLFGKLVEGKVSRNAIPGVSKLPMRFKFLLDRKTLRENRIEMLEQFNLLVEAAKLPDGTREDRVDALIAEFTNVRRSYGTLSRMRNAVKDELLICAYQTVIHWGNTLVTRRTAIAAVAAERYRLVNGHWPKTLDELIPRWLKSVPGDPCGHGSLRLLRLADGIFVNSVGMDGRDDGGKYDHNDMFGQGADAGFRLWDPGGRRQPANAAAKNAAVQRPSKYTQ
jgi:hypothetical protein